jgi:hypothetical protein
MSSERLEILISAVGGQAAAQQIQKIGQQASSTASLLGFLRAALVAKAGKSELSPLGGLELKH